MTKVNDSSRAHGADRARSTRTTAGSEAAPTLDDVAPSKHAERAASFTGSKGADRDAAVHAIEGKLSELHISDDDARGVVQMLTGLSAADRALVWNAMGPESQKRLIDNLDKTGKSALLGALTESGVVEKAPLTRHPTSIAPTNKAVGGPWGTPPEPPQLLARDTAQSPALQELIHENNVEEASRYRSAYDDYLGEYRDQVVLPAAANDDIASIRAAGPPAPLMLPEREAGAPLGAPGRVETDRAATWISTVDGAGALGDVYAPITRAVHHARGEMMGGELRVSVEGEARFGAVGASVGLEGGADDVNLVSKMGVAHAKEGTVGPDGRTRGGHEVGASAAVGEDGSVRVSGGVKTPAAGGSVTIEQSADGSVDIAEVGASLGVAGVGADLKKGTVKVELGQELEIPFNDRAKVGVKVGAEFKPFTSADQILTSLLSGGFYEAPPELSKGTPWKSLAPERRAQLESANGWSEREWTAQQKRLGSLAVPFMAR